MFYVTWTLRKYLLARAALNKEISLEVIVSQHYINEVCLLCIDCANITGIYVYYIYPKL